MLLDMSNQYPTVDAFLIRKWQHAFYTFFDLNGNGVIEWADFSALIELIGIARGTKSTAYVTAKLCLMEVWDSMTEEMDKDREAKISLGDWISMWAASLTQPKEPEWQRAYVDYIFRLLDASGDRLVDQAEYVQVLGYFSISRSDAQQCFDTFAVDTVGHPLNAIDNQRFRHLWREFFRSTDTKAIGNHLLGNVRL